MKLVPSSASGDALTAPDGEVALGVPDDAVPDGEAADGEAADGDGPGGAVLDGAGADDAAAACVVPGSGAGVGGATLPWQASSASASAEDSARGCRVDR